MPERSHKFNQVGITSMSRLRSLENLRIYSTLKKGAIKNEEPPKKPKNMRPYKVKVVDITFSATGQWYLIVLSQNLHSIGQIREWKKIIKCKLSVTLSGNFYIWKKCALN